MGTIRQDAEAEAMDARDEKLMLISDRLKEVFGERVAFVVIVQSPGENPLSVHNLESGRDALPMLNVAAMQFGEDDHRRRRYMRTPEGTVRVPIPGEPGKN